MSEAVKFAILAEATEWPEDELDTRLARRCAGTGVTPEEVRALLAQGDAADRLIPDRGDEPRRQLPELPGFSVECLLGVGGMGAVYRARQHRPAREVAVKLVSGRLAGRDQRLRFMAEQEALARLNHPGIAQFHHAGETADGELFFVMELVSGEVITRYCDQHRLTLDQRVALLASVCDAVQHAHQKQILHRDLKPSNILVAGGAEGPQVKVIDFGIAKALDGGLTEETLLTGDHLLGTPAYMSPEALRGESDTRSDVYSLGMVLYELLAGTRPFEEDNPSRGELVYRVHNAPRPLPSQQVQRLSSRGQVAERRQLQPDQLAGALRGDLDAIVHRATERLADDRYASVAELAADLRRYLASEPVTARRIGWREQTGKFFRRNRALAFSLTGLVAVTVIGGLVATAGWIEARQQARAATEAAQQATRAAREAEELATFLTDIFALADPNENVAGEVTARALIDKAAADLAQRFPDQPLLRARLARTIADVYSKLGAYDAALPLLQSSLALQETTGPALTRDMAETRYDLGVVATHTANYDEALAHYNAAMTLQEQLGGPMSGEVAHTLNAMGSVMQRLARYDDALPLDQRAADIWEHTGDRADLARALDGLASVDLQAARTDRALERFERAAQLRLDELGPRHPHTAASHFNLCIVHRQVGDLEKAADHCQRAETLYRQSLGEQHETVGFSLYQTAKVQAALGNLAEARRLRLAAIDLLSVALGRDHPRTAEVLHTEGYESWHEGDYERALAAYREAHEIFVARHGTEHRRAVLSRLGLGATLWKLGRYGEAEETLVGVVELMQADRGDHNHTSLALEYLADLHAERGAAGDAGRALDYYDRLLAMIDRAPQVSTAERTAAIRARREALAGGPDG